MHDQTVDHLGECLHHRVELGGPESYPATVQRGIRSPGDDASTVLGEGDPVAVAPHTWVPVEVGAAVARAVVVAEKAERHRGHGCGDHEFALHTGGAPVAVLVKRGGLPAENLSGDLAVHHRHHRVPADEATADVGAAGDRVDDDVRSHHRLQPLESLDRERGTGGADLPDPSAVGFEPCLATVHVEARRRAEHRGLRPFRNVPQGVEARASGVSVEQHDRTADQQA
ncbi:unannotated protein [freshwater metagenome]|uniref:Unannotated protein n=1 Tax=freshwater metagenome TaxID=449393 RepID=A0A6J7ECX8_9ZZZZ